MIVSSPYRLDLVPAGISDMSWWFENSKCISACCVFDEGGICFEANYCDSESICVLGLGDDNDIYIYSDTDTCQLGHQLIKSSIEVALQFLRDNANFVSF